jgi:hypothetical protein
VANGTTQVCRCFFGRANLLVSRDFLRAANEALAKESRGFGFSNTDLSHLIDHHFCIFLAIANQINDSPNTNVTIPRSLKSASRKAQIVFARSPL